MERAPDGGHRDQARSAGRPDRDQGDIRDLADKGLTSSYAVPEHIVFVEELPKTSIGKHKKALRERFGK